MENKKDIKEIFLPLANRLLQYESGAYLSTAGSEFFEDGFERDFPIDGMITHLVVQANLHDDESVYREATKYQRRIKLINRELKKRTHSVYTGEELTQESQDKLFNTWKDELDTYSFHLKIIQKQRSSSVQKDSEQNNIYIQLPENFKVVDITKNFQPYLSVQGSALFLYFLRNEGIIPNYTDLDLADLSKVFLGRSEQKTRTNFSKIYEILEDEKPLIDLREMLEKLIKAIDFRLDQ